MGKNKKENAAAGDPINKKENAVAGDPKNKKENAVAGDPINKKENAVAGDPEIFNRIDKNQTNKKEIEKIISFVKPDNIENFQPEINQNVKPDQMNTKSNV